MLRTPRSASILTWSIVAQLVPASNRSTRTWVDCHQKRKEDRIGRHLWISSLRLKTREALSHGKNIKFTKSESSKRPSWVFAKFKLSLSIQQRAEALGDMVQYDPNLERPFSGYLPHTKGKEPVTLAMIADQAKSGFLFCHVAIRD